jgi:hypothetical protein
VSALANLYRVTTKVLIQAVKRNSKRFPKDFMIRLTAREWAALRSQIVTSKLQRGGVLPLDLLDSRTISWIQEQKQQPKSALAN